MVNCSPIHLICRHVDEGGHPDTWLKDQLQELKMINEQTIQRSSALTELGKHLLLKLPGAGELSSMKKTDTPQSELSIKKGEDEHVEIEQS